MDINIYNENLSHRENLGSSRNMLLQKIFRFTSIIVGIVVSILITIDLGDKLFKTYIHGDHFRNLNLNSNDSNASNLSENNSSFKDPIKISSDEAHGLEITNLLNLQKELMINFYNKVDRHTYRGKWHSQEKINFLSERTEGEIAFRIEKINTFNTFDFEKIFIVFRLLDGHYIDKWALIRSINKPFANLTIRNNSMTQILNSFVDYGEIFEKVDYKETNANDDIDFEETSKTYNTQTSQTALSTVPSCKTIINLEWSKNNYATLNTTNLMGSFSFSSYCGFNNITFNLELETDDEDYWKVILYSAIVSGLALTQIFNTIWLTLKVSDSQTFANSISLITVLQNIVWNAYGCLCHFFLTYYTLQFGIPAFLYFANFSIFEIKLLYSLWRIKNLRYINDQAIIRKKLIQFYFFFYIVMFFSLFYVMKFFFEKPYIFSAIIFTWVPQIIFNAIYRNKTSMPLMNIFLIGLNKIFLPFYFRGCPENFFQLSHDYKFIAICLICLTLETLFMYSQTILGPRWFLPKRYYETTFNFYKTKTEVLFIRPDAEYHDCVICLFSLLSNDNYKHFEDDFVAAAGSESTNTKYVCNYFDSFKHIWKNFHDVSFNINKKPYMMTPCKHFFHTPCLESWFKQKKECPSCRQDIDETSIGMAL